MYLAYVSGETAVSERIFTVHDVGTVQPGLKLETRGRPKKAMLDYAVEQ